MITAKSLGVLLHIAGNPLQGGAEALCEVFQEGRDSLQKAINELKEAEMVRMKTYKIPGGYYRSLELTEKGEEYLGVRVSRALEFRASIQQYELNSNINIYANLAIKQTESTREPSEEYTNVIKIGRTVDFYEEDIAEERRKDQIRKHKEKIEMKQKRHEERRMQRRDPNNTSAWSSTDIAFEFAERVFNLMHIKPWQVTRSRFIFALADKRKEYGTTGDVELVMINLYFMQISHDKSLTDPEIVWKRFILQFGNLLTEAKRHMVTPEDMAIEKELAEKSAEWMDNV